MSEIVQFQSVTHSPPKPFTPSRPLLFGWYLALFLLCVVLFTRENRFPYFYHPDEPDKVDQILTGEWNFHHPVLLLDSTLAATKWTSARTPQQVVECGRWVSAVFCAGAVVALSIMAGSLGGFSLAVACGLMLAFHHQLFELSHYFKEDPAMLFGVALFFLMLRLYGKSRATWVAALLGVACGIAFSGKYLGGALVLFALPLLFQRTSSGKRSWTHFALFLLGFSVVAAAINLPLLQHFTTFESSFHREMNLVVEGQTGARRSVPHTLYWNVFVDNTTPLIWIFLIAHIATFLKTRREHSLDEWLITVFPFAFALMLSFSPKTNDRYFLPATAMFMVLAARGMFDLAQWARSRVRIPNLALIIVAIGIAAQLPSFFRYYSAFQHDDRAELRRYIETHLPPNAVIVSDDRAGLPVSGNQRDAIRQQPLQQKVLGGKVASNLGPFDNLKSLGITHAAVSKSTYGRYFLKSQPTGQKGDEFKAARTFYETLFQRGTLLWERERGTVIYLHPGIRLYELPKAAAP